MNLSSENYKDISKYFKDCYVKYPDEAGDKLFYVEKIGSEYIKGQHKDEESKESAPYIFHLQSEKDEDFKAIHAEFLLPKKSFFMHNDAAHFLYRKPLRQYRRGICEDNTQILKLDSSGSFHDAGMSFDLLQSYVDKKSFEGFDTTGKRYSYAVSPRMAVSRSGLIYVDKVRVGSYSYKTLTISLKNDMFLPEIKAILETNAQTIAIAVGKAVEEEVV